MSMDNSQRVKAKFHFGLYFRTPNRVHFWGWGDPAASHAEQPWAGLADWLRRAHSSAFFQHHGPASIQGSEVQSYKRNVPALPLPAVPEAGAKRKLRFVCNRNVIGLQIR